MSQAEMWQSVEQELLKNGFDYYCDWEYGPVSGWANRQDHYSLKLMRHDFGYWLIISANYGGENKRLNVGSSNSAKEIICIRDALSTLF